MEIKHSAFFTGQGIREDFFSAVSEPKENFISEFYTLLEEYEKVLPDYGCSADSEILFRLHLSDVANQYPQIEEFLRNRKSFIPVIGQPPVGNRRIALEAWHWAGGVKEKNAGAVTVRLQNYSPSWFAVEDTGFAGSYDQTAGEFELLRKYLAGSGACVADHTVRTWLYCRDVDNNYYGLVQARNKFFAENGLSADTHFIASTGIEGQCSRPDRLVRMDSVNYPGLQPGQMQYLYALSHLSPTAVYGVSFERGTRLIFGDRSHVFISGTASIDHEGKILFPNDVKKQTHRVMENMEALLNEAEAGLQDVKSATVYLRDPADTDIVSAVIYEYWNKNIPLVILKAPVCRPGWLVEIECIAVNDRGKECFKSFA